MDYCISSISGEHEREGVAIVTGSFMYVCMNHKIAFAMAASSPFILIIMDYM